MKIIYNPTNHLTVLGKIANNKIDLWQNKFRGKNIKELHDYLNDPAITCSWLSEQVEHYNDRVRGLFSIACLITGITISLAAFLIPYTSLSAESLNTVVVLGSIDAIMVALLILKTWQRHTFFNRKPTADEITNYKKSFLDFIGSLNQFYTEYEDEITNGKRLVDESEEYKMEHIQQLKEHRAVMNEHIAVINNNLNAQPKSECVPAWMSLDEVKN